MLMPLFLTRMVQVKMRVRAAIMRMPVAMKTPSAQVLDHTLQS